MDSSDIVIDNVTQVKSKVTKAAGDSDVDVFSVVDINGDNLFQVTENGNAIIGGVLTVEGTGTSTFTGDVQINQNLTVSGSATVNAALAGNSMTLTGDLNVYGDTIIGDSAANDTIGIASRFITGLIPQADNTHDLGSASLQWKDIYINGIGYIDQLSAEVANIDNIQIDGNTVASTSGVLYIDPNPIDSDGGDVIIRGNLTVSGQTTTVNSTTVSINDKNIVLADSAASAGEADGAGITINGPGVPATITYNGSTDRWEFNKEINIPSGNLQSILLDGVTLQETLEDHLVTNFFLAGEGIDLTYVDGSNTLTIAAELATTANAGVANFDSDQMTVTGGLVSIYEVDGGTY